MNTLDIAFVVGALGIAAVTFTQPPVTVVADLIALYVASVLAGMLYLPVTRLPIVRVLPGSDALTVRLTVFVVLLVGGALLLRGLLRRAAGMMTMGQGAAGALFGNLLSAGLSVLFALAVVLIAVVAFAAIAQMPSSAGIVVFARQQTASSHVLPRLAEPLAVYLRLVALCYRHGLPEVYANISGVTTPL